MKATLPTFTCLLAALGLSLLGRAPAAYGQCIDYGDHLHWVGGVDTPGRASDVAVSGGFAYVADADSGLQVADISDPASPVIVGWVETPGRAIGVAVSGSHAYVADCSAGLQVVDVSDPASPAIIGSAATPDCALALAVSGCTVYIVGSFGLCVVDVCDPASPVIVGCVDTPGGYARGVAVSGSYVYVADYWYSGLLVVDVSNPASPVIVGSVDTPGLARGVAVSGSYVYALNTDAGLLVVDVSDPTSPVIVGAVDTGRGGFVTASGSHAYVAGARRGLQVVGLQVVDVSDPTFPVIVGSADTPSEAWRVAVSGSHAYVADGYAGLQVVNVSNPSSPPPLGGVDTPGEAWDVAVSGSHAYVVDRRGLRVVSISDPSSPKIVGNSLLGLLRRRAVTVSGSYIYVAEGGPLNVSDYQPGPDRSEPVARGQSPGTWARLRVFDVSDPASPTVAGGIDIPNPVNFPLNLPPQSAVDIAVSGSYAYVAERSGLHVVDVSDPTSPTIMGSVPSPGRQATRVAVSGSHAYVAYNCFWLEGDCGLTWLEVVDVTDPVSPATVGSVDMPGKASGIAISGSYAYVAGRPSFGEGGIRVADISDPTSPVIVAAVATSFTYSDIEVSGSYAYATLPHGLQVWDISAPASPEIVGGAPTPSWARDVAVSETCVYVASRAGLQILPTQCPEAELTRAVLAHSGRPGRDRRPGLRLAIPAPNPVSVRTMLSFSLPGRQHTQLALYDVAGRRVRTFVDRTLPEGDHSVTWDARDHAGRRVAPGTYFVRLITGEVTRTRKVVYLGGK